MSLGGPVDQGLLDALEAAYNSVSIVVYCILQDWLFGLPF